MRKLLMLIWLLSPILAKAQYVEAGVMAGLTNYLGDLAPTSYAPSATHFGYGAFFRYNAHPFFSVKANVARGYLSASDEFSVDQARLRRNLSFRSWLTEFGVTGEFNILGYAPESRKRFSPYVFGGVAVFHYNPKAEFEGFLYELQPLGTEGQGMPGRPKPYALTQISIPLGGGIKFLLNDYVNIGAELGFRKTFTDYLDDVSSTYVNREELIAANGLLAANLANRTGEFLGTEPVSTSTGVQRGDPNDLDWYIIGGLTVSYNFLNAYGSYGRMGGRSTGCPKF